MLDSLRRASRTWVAKMLLLLLVVSFGVWGVSSSMLTSSSDTVIAVGDQSVSSEEFRLAYQRQIAELSRQFGTQLTTEQARAFGIDRQVFAQLAAGAALDQLSQDMRLGLSKDRLATLIAEDPAFRAVNGQFDRALFTSRLRNAGLREDDYIQERSKVAVRSQIVEAVSDGFTPPQVLTDALQQYVSETRAIDYVLLSNANIDPVKAPGDDVLAAWFEGVKSRYRAPEYRKFTYVKLEPSDIAEPADITDEAVSEEYERRKNTFRTPETRTIEQLTFPNKEMADAAATQLRERMTTFDQLVADQGKTASDVRLGDFTRDAVPDQTIADAAFGVATDGGTTPVVEGMFGPVILRVTNIRPETTKTFDDVKEELRQDLALAAAVQDILNVHDRYEDLRGSGATLEEAARELKLTAVVVEAADSTGRNPDNDEIRNLPVPALITEVFNTEVGTEALPINIGRDGYVWFEVNDVIAERDRTLDEAREDVVADWTAEQQRAALGARAEELKARLEAGEELAAIAEDLGIAVETKEGVRRNSQDAILGPEAVSAIFAGPLGVVGNAVGADGETRILLKVTSVDDQASAGASDGDMQQLEAIAKAAGDDMLDQMVNALQSSYGVSINQAVADQAMVR